jgi:hypothetical protein
VYNKLGEQIPDSLPTLIIQAVSSAKVLKNISNDDKFGKLFGYRTNSAIRWNQDTFIWLINMIRLLFMFP